MADEMIQGSDEWLRARSGKFTASCFADVLARNKRTGEPLKAYDDLIWNLVTERMTGEPMAQIDGYALRWGSDVEPFAREAYALETGLSVLETGFLLHPEYPFAGASPDGLIGDDGGLEMKCPKNSRVHLERFESGVPPEYVPQIQGGMWVTSRQWWDFVSYDPRMPESHQLLRIRVERDQAYIDKLEAAVLEAEAKVQDLYQSVLKKAA